MHGGKTDQFNSYSYTSAPNSNDLLYLPLSNTFDVASPPWELVSSSSNTSTSQGPALAWHTISAFNTSALLLFGGDPGPNSATVIPYLADSAALLNVFDRMEPVWMTEEQAWADEPMRRIRHSACSSGGKIWIVGGEKDDGSSQALSDHWVFDPTIPSFTQLPADNGPPDLYGHSCAVLSDGRMLIFGGYSQSMNSLVPLTTIWIVDTTQSTLTWQEITLSGSTVPSSRRSPAVVLLEGGKILIHGGADAVLQTAYSDGWVLDTTQNPMVWTAVDALSQLGPRYDHFAIGAGSQVVFGFGRSCLYMIFLHHTDIIYVGYSSNGAAATTLQIFDTSSDTFVSSFKPVTTVPTNTLATPTQTQTQTHTGASGTATGTGTKTSSNGASTGTAGAGTGTTTGSIHPTYTQGDPNPSSEASKSKATTAIAVGTAFGVMALIAGAIATGYYLKHHRNYPTTGQRFHLLGGDGSNDGDSEHMVGVIPTAGVQREKYRSGTNAWFHGNKETNNEVGVGHALNNTGPQRRDMFADEDREFGVSQPYGFARDGSGGSSWSIQSVTAAIGTVGSGIRGILSRENSASGHSFHGAEASDPFLAATLLRDVDNPYNAASTRPTNRREMSYASTLRSYTDPFADHPVEEAETGYNDLLTGDAEADESTHLTYPQQSYQSNVPPTLGLHTLSPLTEQTSRSTDPSSSRSSQELRTSPFDSAYNSSVTSHEYRPQRRSSIINSNPPNVPIRRSDSWWARFAKTSFLERRSSERLKSPTGIMDFRDPNPAPRLNTIQEASAHSNSPDSPESKSKRNKTEHRKSQSSLQTTRTADSEAIERMGGMDVIQRIGTNGTTPSTGRDTPERDPSWTLPRSLSVVASSGRSEGSSTQHDDSSMVESPVEMTSKDLVTQDSSSDNSTPAQRPISSAGVMDRIQAYERRMSQDAPVPVTPLSPNARNTRKKEEHPSKSRVTINYGLAPRPSLFVANPDHKGSPSSES